VSDLESPAGTIVHKDMGYMFKKWCTRKVEGAGCNSRKSAGN
jgi:hypothetical protein